MNQDNKGVFGFMFELCNEKDLVTALRQLSKNVTLNYCTAEHHLSKKDEELLRKDLGHIHQILRFLTRSSLEKSHDKHDLVASLALPIYEELCSPVLNNHKPHLKQYVVTRILKPICKYLPEQLLEKIIGLSKRSIIESLGKDVESGTGLDVSTSMLVMSVVIDTLADSENNPNPQHQYYQEIFDHATSVLSELDEQKLSQVNQYIFQKMLALEKDKIARNLSVIWTVVKELYYKMKGGKFIPGRKSSLYEQSYQVLCALAQWYFPVDGKANLSPRLEDDEELWILLQSGLCHPNALARKRSIYLLKRIIDISDKLCLDIGRFELVREPRFWWRRSDEKYLRNMYQNLILLIEGLEEVQVHVITPLFPKIKLLVEATKQRPEGAPFLHTSWLCTIFNRIAIHESDSIQRLGLQECLTIDMRECPMLQQGMDEFVTVSLVASLAGPHIYHRSAEVFAEECPQIAAMLSDFLTSCLESLANIESQAVFIQNYIKTLLAKHWNGASLVFIARALSMIPPMKTLGPNSLQDLKHLICSTISTCQTHHRRVVECYVLDMVLNLANDEEGVLESLVELLCIMFEEKSIKRGTNSWKRTTSWLEKQMGNKDISQLVTKTLAKLEEKGSHSTPNQKRCLESVVLLLLCIDAGLLSLTPSPEDRGETTCVQTILEPFKNTILTMNHHAYMSELKANSAIQFLFVLSLEATGCKGDKEDKVRKLMESLIHVCSSEVVNYIFTKVSHEFCKLSDLETTKIYVDALKLICSSNKELSINKRVEEFVSVVTAPLDSGKIPTEVAVKRSGILQLLAVLCDYANNLNLESSLKNLSLLNPTSSLRLPKSEETEGGISVTMVSCDYVSAQWQCIDFVLRTWGCADQWDRYMEACIDTLDVISIENTQYIFQPMSTLLSMEQADSDECVKAIEMGWEVVKTASKSSRYWDTLQQFTAALFSVPLLKCKEGDPRLSSVMQLFDDLLTRGEGRGGIANCTISHLCSYLETHKLDTLKYLDILIRALVFGPLPTKGLKHQSEVSTFFWRIGDSLATNELHPKFDRENVMVRLMALNVLTKLQPNVAQEKEVAQEIFRRLMVEQKKVNAALTAYSNFPNAIAHRRKHRIFLALQILSPHIDEAFSKEVVDFLHQVLEIEVQPSVRCQAESMLVKILVEFKDHLERVWKRLECTQLEKTTTVCSYLCIITQLIRQPWTKDNLEPFVEKAVCKILPWCMTHHMNSRLHAQTALHQLLTISKDNEHAREKFSFLENFEDFHQLQSSAVRSATKLKENVSLILDPVRDYSIETICHTLPRLVGLADDEYIDVELFKYIDPSWETDTERSVPLTSSSEELKACEPGLWKFKQSDFGGETSDGDIQKKVIPWASMLPQEDLESGLQEEYDTKRQKTGKLVLVTSLIDKVANLGGLCRTSEIFGVSEFVIGNINHVDDSIFKKLSVTAHKWIPITEVKVWMLKDYLEQMKLEGYTLIGIEQTAGSVCLNQYQFPEKSLLLLGNEKEGIPVDLIHLLDACVEIPQVGLIRSLNVHVSGALVVWEYARQQMIQHS